MGGSLRRDRGLIPWNGTPIIKTACVLLTADPQMGDGGVGIDGCAAGVLAVTCEMMNLSCSVEPPAAVVVAPCGTN